MPASRRKTSFVWQHFEVSEVDERKAICNRCGAMITRGKDSRNYSTSSLASHLRYCRGKDAGLPAQQKQKRSSHTAPSNIDVLLLNYAKPCEIEEQSSEKNSTYKKKPHKKLDDSSASFSEAVQTTDTTNETDTVSHNYVMPDMHCDDTQDVICSKRVDLVHSGLMMHTLYQQHRTGKFCDLTLIAAQQDSPALVSQSGIMVASRPKTRKVFNAHSSVLAGLSVKVKTLIEMGSRTIELKDVSPFGLNSLLEIVYTGKLKPGPTLRFYEIHQIWKAACDLGVGYVRNYIMQEHPQVSKWIQDEQKQAKSKGDARFPSERFQEELSDDLVDMCAMIPERELDREEGVEVEDIHVNEMVDQFPGPSVEIDESADKKDESSLVEITFTKT